MRITDRMLQTVADADEEKRIGVVLLWLWQAEVLTDGEYASAVAQATLVLEDDADDVDVGGTPC